MELKKDKAKMFQITNGIYKDSGRLFCMVFSLLIQLRFMICIRPFIASGNCHPLFLSAVSLAVSFLTLL